MTNFLKNIYLHTELVQEFILDAKNFKQMARTSSLIINTLKQNKKLIFIGNGGSAAEAQHMAAELVCKLNIERKAFASFSIVDRF